MNPGEFQWPPRPEAAGLPGKTIGASLKLKVPIAAIQQLTNLRCASQPYRSHRSADFRSAAAPVFNPQGSGEKSPALDFTDLTEQVQRAQLFPTSSV
jgi:hypothetical protein